MANDLIIIIYVLFAAFCVTYAILQFIVTVKLYHVCNYILSIRDDKVIVTIKELKYLKATKNSEYEKKLNKFIFDYLTLSTEYYTYENKYKHIIDVCKQNEFEIPEAFIDLDTEEKFNKAFF